MHVIWLHVSGLFQTLFKYFKYCMTKLTRPLLAAGDKGEAVGADCEQGCQNGLPVPGAPSQSGAGHLAKVPPLDLSYYLYLQD